MIKNYQYSGEFADTDFLSIIENHLLYLAEQGNTRIHHLYLAKKNKVNFIPLCQKLIAPFFPKKLL